MAQEALGRLIDISVGVAPVDLSVAASTGKRVGLRNAAGVTVVFRKGAGAGGEDPVLTFRQHTAASGGTSQNLATVDHYYTKSAATLAGTETWNRAAQAAAGAGYDCDTVLERNRHCTCSDERINSPGKAPLTGTKWRAYKLLLQLRAMP